MPCTWPIPRKLPLPIIKVPAPDTTLALQYKPEPAVKLKIPAQATVCVELPKPPRVKSVR